MIKSARVMLVAVLLALPWAARADEPAADPATIPVTAFYGVLLQSMKDAKTLGFKGRYDRLDPAISDAFDLPDMTRYCVGGGHWAKMTPDQQTAVVSAFRRYTVASYAHNFDGYGGEKFVVDPKATEHGADRVVRTKLVQGDGSTIDFAYRMMQTGGDWKIVDVYLENTISQVLLMNAQFGAILLASGPQGLIDHLNKAADDLAK